MNRLCSFVLALALAPAGCAATGDEGFVIRNNLAPDGTTCSFDADASAPFIARGFLHSSSPVPYLLTPLIESRIVAATGEENVRTVALKGARVDLEIGPISILDAEGETSVVCTAEGEGECFSETERDDLAAAGITKFRQLFSAPLAPNGGLSSASFDLIPTQVIREIERKAGTLGPGARLHAQVVATSTLFGDLAGDELEGLPYTYPVTVCSDCVVNVVGACADLPDDFEARTGNPCNPFQDGAVDCCSSGTALVCPAVRSAVQ